jgi:hypothetical protein
LLCSCSHRAPPGIERLAILPGNILIADPAAEWLRLAVPLAVAEDLTTSRNLSPIVADGESGAYRAAASEMLEATVEERQGRFRIEAAIRDMKTQRNRRVITAAGASAAGLIAVVNRLAKSIDPRATDYSTNNDQALQAFAAAAQESNSQSQVQSLTEAIQVDPGFGAAHIALIELLARSGARNVQSAIANAKAHEAAFTALDRARFQEIVTRISHAPLAQQTSAAAALLRLAPNNLDALTSLAADRFLQGDAGAGALLNRALQVSPGNASLPMDLAEGLFETKQFAKAEKIFVRLDSDVAVLPDLAACILLEGDRARASSVFASYVQRLQDIKEPLAPMANAGWLAISGQLPQAIASLQSAQFHQADLESIALSQIAVWQTATKDTAAAKKTGAQALGLAKAPIARVFAIAATLIANGDVPPEQWQARVNASPLDNGTKQVLLGYGFFLFGHYNQAAQVWQTLLTASGNIDLRSRAMLASSLDHAGKPDEAAKILVQPFLPNLTGGRPVRCHSIRRNAADVTVEISARLPLLRG